MLLRSAERGIPCKEETQGEVLRQQLLGWGRGVHPAGVGEGQHPQRAFRREPPWKGTAHQSCLRVAGAQCTQSQGIGSVLLCELGQAIIGSA